jgi:hypothetical protein
MQKAYAAYAAADSDHGAFVPANLVAESEVEAGATSHESAAPSESMPAVVEPVPELASTIGQVATVATEAVTAAVKEFETVAASYVTENESTSAAESAPVESATSETSSAVEQQAEEPLVALREESAPAHAEPEYPAIQDFKTDMPENASPVADVPTANVSDDSVPQIMPEQPTSSETPANYAAEVRQPEAEGTNKESDISTTTAAAWASWRRIRESSPTHPAHPQEPSQSDSTSHDAAMAVAAGAESNPEEIAKDESDPAIASIVDSVLADLRPKIVEEISRKLGKRK